MSRIPTGCLSRVQRAASCAALAWVAWPLSADAQLRVERRAVGDTTVVRTIGVEPPSATRRVVKDFTFGKLDGPAEYVFGSISGVRLGVNGSILVFDRSVPLLQQYDSTGKYIRAIGRGGQGPGEYPQAVGIQSAPNGTIYLLNRAANRVSVYGPSGAHVTDWRVPQEGMGGVASALASGTLVIDTAGLINVLASIGSLPPAPPDPRPRPIQAIVRYRADGTVRDTLRIPSLGLEPTPMLRAVSPAGGTRGTGLSHTPNETWSFTRHGNFVGGRQDRFQIHILGGRGKVTRIERDTPPVPLSAAERAAIRERVTRTLRAYDPLWIWNGPEVPRVKPFFGGVLADDDGRIWVQVHSLSQRVPDAERSAVAANARGRTGEPPMSDIPSFREPLLYEVFAPDGRYLGRVEMPQLTYAPHIKGNWMWSGTLDADGVPVVTRFRIEPPLPR